MRNLPQKLAKGIFIGTAILATSGLGSVITGNVIRSMAERDYQKTTKMELTINEDNYNQRRQIGDVLESMGVGGIVLAALPYVLFFYNSTLNPKMTREIK